MGAGTKFLALAAATIALGLPPHPASALVDDPPFQIRQTSLKIEIDGVLGDAGWADATPIETWYETRPGDNLPAKIGSVARLVYDDQFLYAAFEFSDPEPERIRAPLANRDNVPSYTDYGGILIDANNDGSTAQMFLANPRGIQYDAISSDASGEDSAPDFFWDSAAKITPQGWVLEMRVPFSSLRYTESNPEQWRILLYRNYPREFRYQFFSSKLPRDSTCFICNATPLVGLEDLPSGGHFVVAPYTTGAQSSAPAGDVGTPLVSDDAAAEIGLDVKWSPNPNTILDLTLNPDFSQIETDAPLISANERFALFFPEKRPFFLEGADLFSTPLTAVYTRSFASPRWGARATGEFKGNTYTFLAGEDRGGGSVIIPGPQGSSLVDQDQESTVTVGRLRHNFGDSFVSFIYTGRDVEDNSYNRVLGPDFRWQVTDNDVISGQLLFSKSRTPNLPDLAEEWDGRDLSGHAAELWWYRKTKNRDYFALYKDLSNDFRADNGFIPQVGVRRGFSELGRSFYPKDKPISRLRLFTKVSYGEDRDGLVLNRFVMPGFGFDGILNSFVRVEFLLSEQRSGTELIRRNQIRPRLELRPGGVLSQIQLRATFGDEVDFANDRKADGRSLGLRLDLQPTDHLKLSLDASQRELDVTTDEGLSGELFKAEVAQLRATYTFSSKSWLRLIGQWVRTERQPELYDNPEDVTPLSENLGGSLVFAYKLNWQSVLFVGYGEHRELDPLDRLDRLRPASEQVFVKLSYAFQR